MTSRRLLLPLLLANAFLFINCVSQDSDEGSPAAPGEQISQKEESLIGTPAEDDAPIRLDMEVQAAAPAAPARPLKILVSNDDGWTDPGIQAMKRGLKAAGHSVTLIAPAQDKSGSSASLSASAPVTVTTQTDGDLAVDGTPATSVLIGLAVLEARGERPDLIVSGPNFGFDGGPTAPYSGTLGAATAGVIRGIPSIAVMADPVTRDKTDPIFTAHVERVAEFTARLIARLEAASHSKKGLLPEGIGLKVGYPPLAADKIAGVTLVTQGKTGISQVIYRETSPGVFSLARGTFDPVPGDVSGDVVNYRAGFITVLPFDADLTASRRERHHVRRLLTGLKP